MRILLVEDEPSAATMLAKGLGEEAYAVDIAFDGEMAQGQAFVNDYDLIILDVVLPGKDGFQVCRELRASGLTVPVLMLTARDAVEDRVAGLDSGADDYLPKAFYLITGTGPNNEKMDLKTWEWSGKAEATALRQLET